MLSNKYLISICGPTAVGKTEIAIRLANHFSAEIISADSRQFYKEMNIGTAKPDKFQLAQVKHHLVNSLSINENYTVSDYEQDVIKIIHSLFNINKPPITSPTDYLPH